MTRGPFFEVHYSHLANNERTGFEYNPHYSALEVQEMRQGIHNPIILRPNMAPLKISNEGYLFLVTEQETSPILQTYDVEVYVSRYHKVVVDILDYNPDIGEEKVSGDFPFAATPKGKILEVKFAGKWSFLVQNLTGPFVVKKLMAILVVRQDRYSHRFILNRSQICIRITTI